VVNAPALAGGTRRLQTIDALRGGAALAVVLYHASVFNAGLGRGWANTWTEVGFGFGRFGVWLFFVISGFCIHLRWASQYAGAPGRAPRLDFVAFWKRRFVRLYPPYAIALAIYIAWLAFEGLRPTGVTLWRIALHVTMLNNMDRGAVDAINGVFWTLAVEEQLYLAYFILLRLRIRFGWMFTLGCCLGVRFAWFAAAALLHRTAGVSLLVTQAAAAQWIVWALGAFAVEAYFGIVRLPAPWRSGWFAAVVLAVAMGITYSNAYLDVGVAKSLLWFASDVVWGIGFFVWINRAVDGEARWPARGGAPRWLAPLAALGLFSYSTYLTHELVILHLWPLLRPEWREGMLAMSIELIGVSAASLVFARVFFAWFERPFLLKARETGVALNPSPAVS
jgi:peptidoglycan/LPS O-acetylase OafA/YrhL